MTEAAQVDEHAEHREHLRKEGMTMALYVAVCLLAVLTAVAGHNEEEHVRTLALIWGTTIGLVLAHLFAFRVSAKLIGEGAVHKADAEAAGVQLAGAAVVALLASIAVLLFPASADLNAARIVLAGFIAVVAFAVARSAGAGRSRAFAYAAVVVIVALAIALLKNVLGGH